ncbi:MAG: hypothetical protein QW478_01255 [Candidatus Micrarchaeaceae archaeon]
MEIIGFHCIKIILEYSEQKDLIKWRRVSKLFKHIIDNIEYAKMDLYTACVNKCYISLKKMILNRQWLYNVYNNLSIFGNDRYFLIISKNGIIPCPIKNVIEYPNKFKIVIIPVSDNDMTNLKFNHDIVDFFNKEYLISDRHKFKDYYEFIAKNVLRYIKNMVDIVIINVDEKYLT